MTIVTREVVLAPLLSLLLAPSPAPVLALLPMFALPLTPPAAPSEPASLIARTASTASVALSQEWLELRAGTSSLAALTSSTSTTGEALPIDLALPTPTPASPQKARVRLVYTGGSGGIGSGRYDFGVSRRLTRTIVDGGGQLVSATPYHGVLARGVHVVIAGDRRLGTLRALLEQGGLRCDTPTPARSVRTPKTRMLLDGEVVPEAMTQLRGPVVVTEYDHQRCTGPSGAVAHVYGPRQRPLDLAATRLGEFEVRLGLRLELVHAGAPLVLDVVGVPADDAARRYRALRSLVGAPDVLYLDAGSFVDGASTILDGQLSLHRPLGLRMLEGLGPTALAPGETELAGGARTLLAEARAHGLPYVATNWVSEDPALALPKVLFKTLPTELGLLRIAFLGAVDPGVAQELPVIAREGITLSEPVAALDAEVRRLQTSSTPPDLLVVLTSARWQVYEAIQAEVRGIDLVIGETSPIEDRMQSAAVVLRPSTSRERLSAQIMPIFGVALTELSLVRAKSGRLMLEQITIEPHRTIESLEPDPEVQARVTQTRLATYPELERPLVHPPGTLANPLSRGVWSRLVCETIRQRTDADVVLLPALPALVDVLGPQTELLALNGLSPFDKLERHTIRGKKLVDILRDAGGVTPVSCGGQVGVRSPKVRGRPVDEARTYTLVSTDRARTNGLGAIIGDGYGTRVLDARAPAPELDEAGQPLSLRNAVLASLRALRDQAGSDTAPVDALLEPSETTKASLSLLRISRLALTLSSFVSADEARLPNVKESRVNASSSLTFGGDADLALVLERQAIIAELRALGRYTRLDVEDAEPLEQADDLRFSTSLSVPALEYAVGPATLLPYGEVSFDTEFTPTDEVAGRQAALFFTGGLSLKNAPYITALRVGASAGRDFSLLLPFAFSLRTELESTITFGYELALKLSAVGDWFAPTTGETDANLRFRYTFEGRVALPLARWLNLAAFAQSYVFQGALVDTVGASHTLGFALDVSGAFGL